MAQIKQMNQTNKVVTLKQYHYDSNDQLRIHIADFMDAYNFACRLTTFTTLRPVNT